MMEWVRKSCEWNPDNFLSFETVPTNFPAIGHTIIFTLIACVPILGIFETIIVLAVYIVNRCTGKLILKPTKFNKKFFNVKDNV